MSKTATPARTPNAEDIAHWPDGEWTHLGDIWRTGYHWKSDDYEIVLLEDTARLGELGILDELI